ncbi:MAG TPA: ABC transporter permease subunit [Pyrinomonadaceae bacterium]|nr:ABC transporter permease subunit [Pyrinomonadaceae bacterium]
MAVYEQSYKPYTGRLTPEWSRFLIIPRHAYRAVFNSKLFIAFFAICFLPLLVEAILIYLRHNFGALAAMSINVRELIPVDGFFFETFVNIQMGFAFLMALLIGPPLVSRDLRNNALPLYLCRPFSRTEYVMGKMSVLLILLSLITWIPQLVLFLFQSYLEGLAWFKANVSIAFAIVIASLVWILLLALLSQTISALVKWRVVASGALVGLFLIPSVFGAFINEVFSTRIGNLVSLGALIRNVTAGLFGTFDRLTEIRRVRDFDGTILREIVLYEPPLWSSWAMLFLLCAVCLALLSWKVKAYEVVR